MRSPGIPAVSVMPAPHFKRSYGKATNVTENLIEPPKFRLTRALLLPLALAPTLAHNRVAITGKYVRLALIVQMTTKAPSGAGARVSVRAARQFQIRRHCIRVVTEIRLNPSLGFARPALSESARNHEGDGEGRRESITVIAIPDAENSN